METKWKSRKVKTLGTAVTAKTQPTSLRHKRGAIGKAPTRRAKSGKTLTAVIVGGFERRSDHVADNKRGQVYIVQRLSDPQNKAAVADRLEAISSEKSKALEFLQSIGVASAAGRLTEKFGG